MEKTRNYKVEFVKVVIFKNGKTTDEVVETKTIRGTFDEVMGEARGMVRPMFGGTHYDGDWHKCITLDDRRQIPRGFLLEYKIHYLDERRYLLQCDEFIYVIARC
jgi:hypothetical protein